MSVSKEEVVKYLENMTLLEAADLVKELEKKFGVSATPTQAVGIAPLKDEVEKKEEQTEFSVVLSEIGDKKISVIKEIRTITSLNLKDAKALVEGAPSKVKEGISKEEAAKIKEQLEKAGAKAEIK